jgi:hypothetical protein
MAYLTHVREAFGSEGAGGIVELLDVVKLIFQRCPPESLQGTLTILKGIGASPHAPVLGALGSLTSSPTIETLGKVLAAGANSPHILVEMSPDGSFRSLFSITAADLPSLAQTALVYHFEADVDQIFAGKYSDVVPKVSPILKSNFSTPTLSSLEEALKRYADFVLETRCRILAKVWEGGVDGPRLVLTNRPESHMRDSLVQALELVLRDASVRPEQNTDETKPVDIRVEWFGSGSSALIEVKWLGRSTALSRTGGAEPTYTEYGPPRAQSGADQLADYMDREVRHSNATSPRGYLVVFDARRRNVKGHSDPLSADDAMHFAKSDLVYKPDHSKTRGDFSAPARFFLNPRASFFLAA